MANAPAGEPADQQANEQAKKANQELLWMLLKLFTFALSILIVLSWKGWNDAGCLRIAPFVVLDVIAAVDFFADYDAKRQRSAEPQPDLQAALFPDGIPTTEENTIDKSLLAEQLRSYVTASELFTQRRQTLHSFFAVAIAAILAASMSLIGKVDTTTMNEAKLILWIVTLSGNLLSVCWLTLFRSYDELSRARIMISDFLEEKASLARTTQAQNIIRFGKALDPSNSFTNKEQLLPFCFLLMCSCLGWWACR